MEFISLVALRLSLGVLALASAKLTEVLCRPRGDIGKQLHLHPAEGLACRVISFKKIKGTLSTTYPRGRYQRRQWDWHWDWDREWP